MGVYTSEWCNRAHGNSVFCFVSCETPIVGGLIYSLRAVCKGVSFLHFLPSSVAVCFISILIMILLMITILGDMRWNCNVVFIFIPMIKEGGCFSLCLLAICTSSFRNSVYFISPLIDWVVWISFGTFFFDFCIYSRY